MPPCLAPLSEYERPSMGRVGRVDRLGLFHEPVPDTLLFQKRIQTFPVKDLRRHETPPAVS
jgi:hypothetical protein